MSTGIFFIRQGHAGARPRQPHQREVRAARHRAEDARVAEMLAEGMSMPAIAATLGIQRTKVTAAFRRICAQLGPQSTGTWRIET